MHSFNSRLLSDDPPQRCKDCGKVVGPGEPIIVWVTAAEQNLWHFKCAYCRGFMEPNKTKESKP
jgi:hypothetical protein